MRKATNPVPAKELSFRQRWDLVNAITDAEYRRTPVRERIRQFFELMEQAKSLGWKTTDETEVEAVRERWRKLREGLRGKAKT